MVTTFARKPVGMVIRWVLTATLLAVAVGCGPEGEEEIQGPGGEELEQEEDGEVEED